VRAVLQVLSDDEVLQVHERTLDVLGTVGMRVDTVRGRRLLADAGATVDDAARRVRFPRQLVERSLAAAPARFHLGGRRPGFRVALNVGACSLVADGGCTQVIDRVSGERRAPTREDWRQSTVLQDAIDDIGVYWWMVEPPMGEWGLGDWVRYWAELFGTFSKHVQDSFADPAAAPWLLETMDIVFGGRDAVRRGRPFSFLVTPAAPLIIEAKYTDTWLALSSWGIPVAVMPMPLMGATAPASLLATIVQANCEVLGMLCLAQAAEPGVPFIYAPVLAAVDPRSGRYAGGAVEGSVMAVAGIQLARHYGLPVEASGCTTDAVEPGEQAAYEKALTAQLTLLARPDLFVGPGTLAGATILSFEQLLVDVDMLRSCLRAARGVRVDETAWLADVLSRVGPGGGFIGERSTRVNARGGEWVLPQRGMRGSVEAWTAAGRPTVIDEARAAVDELLATHRPLPLGDDVACALAQLRARAAASRT
jgi:trimethylamine---corrinoid protein Co-methyltransferase